MLNALLSFAKLGTFGFLTYTGINKQYKAQVETEKLRLLANREQNYYLAIAITVIAIAGIAYVILR